MGVNPLGTGGTRPPKVCVGGDTSCIVPPKLSDDTGHQPIFDIRYMC